jgi:uncharacterized protein with HEPN domain
MSFRGPELHFADILRAIALVEDFVGDMTEADYSKDSKTRAAVERELQIITEAAFRLRPEDETLCPGPDWTAWRGMGNLLRHAYHRIDDSVIWNTVTMELPLLKTQVETALATHFSK